MAIKNYTKISKKLYNHESILKAITTYNCKDVLTLEQGNYFYHVILYKDGYELRNYSSIETMNNLEKSINLFEDTKELLVTQHNMNLKFNKFSKV